MSTVRRRARFGYDDEVAPVVIVQSHSPALHGAHIVGTFAVAAVVGTSAGAAVGFIGGLIASGMLTVLVLILAVRSLLAGRAR